MISLINRQHLESINKRHLQINFNYNVLIVLNREMSRQSKNIFLRECGCGLKLFSRNASIAAEYTRF